LTRRLAEHEIDVAGAPDTAWAAVGRAAEAWGAELERKKEGSLLRLPVVSGLRRGVLSGPLSVDQVADGSRVVFRPEESFQAVQTAAVAVLLLALGGAVLTVLWPFFPNLLPVAPFGALFALGGWFLVISRLRSSGPQEFLAAVAAEAEGKGPG
jgi:hypothetical protein